MSLCLFGVLSTTEVKTSSLLLPLDVSWSSIHVMTFGSLALWLLCLLLLWMFLPCRKELNTEVSFIVGTRSPGTPHHQLPHILWETQALGLVPASQVKLVVQGCGTRGRRPSWSSCKPRQRRQDAGRYVPWSLAPQSVLRT